MPRRKPIREQVVVVFGASSGIGRETAKRFAAGGAKVAVAARGEEGLDSLVGEIRAAGGDAFARHADAADFGQVRDFADAAARHFGRIDTWVHVAGVGVYAPFDQTTPEEYRRVVEVDLIGAMNGAKASLPYLIASRDGGFIPVSSVEAVRPLPYHSAYAAAKHGVHGFVDALRMELAHEKLPVQVTEIQPASIDTPFFSDAKTRLGVKPAPIPPVYPPERVADAVVHAAEHPERVVVVSGAGKVLVQGQRLSPTLMDALLGRTAFRGQRTTEPKGEAAPSNLYGPVDDERVKGDFGGMVRAGQVFQWLALGGAVAAAAYLAVPRGKGDRGPRRYEEPRAAPPGPTDASLRHA